MRRRAIIECRERARVSAVQAAFGRAGLDPVEFHLRAAVTVKRRTFKHDPLGSSEQIFGEN
jgi:hypothetical protein